jgi:hypothetical protein
MSPFLGLRMTQMSILYHGSVSLANHGFLPASQLSISYHVNVRQNSVVITIAAGSGKSRGPISSEQSLWPHAHQARGGPDASDQTGGDCV